MASGALATLAPLCGHAAGLREDGYRLRCRACGSFFDAAAARAALRYDTSYPEQRGHFDPEVGAIVHALPPREASEMLVSKARQRARGGGDNLSLALVRVDPLE